ncbi:MAG: hypothetical protein KBD46_02485 [Candidatus Levybacteria bacterium]|nr:hypothetical protein [Candidatus Levybacteria bacterium]
MSYETKTIIVVLTLLFVTPVGLILMWVWMKWPLWVRILLTVLPFLFAFLITGFVLSILAIVFSNPQVQREMQTQIKNQSVIEGKVCGGPVLTPCPTGYTCKTTTVKSGKIEETSGVCIPQ